MTMDVSIDTLVNVLSLLLGGGGGAFFVWRWQRKKAKAEAESAEIDAAKELQDMYQQMLADSKSDREDRKQQMEELRQERDHYKDERNELRERMDKTDESVRQLQREVARNGRQIELMRPFLCYDQKCKKRQLVDILASAENKNEETSDIEPYDDSDKA